LGAGGRPADEQGEFYPPTLHFGRHRGHFLKRRRDQPREPDGVRSDLDGGVEDLCGGHHDAKIDDLVVVAAEHHAHDVLADVVDVALDGGEDELAPGGPGLLLGLEKGLEVGDGFFHHPGALDHLGEEHLARAKEVAHDAHAIHQGAFDDLDGAPELLPCLLGVVHDEIRDAVHQGMGKASLDLGLAPGEILDLLLRPAADAGGEVDHALGGVLPAIEEDVLHVLEKIRGNVFVDFELPGVDDPHGHSSLDGVVEEGGVDGLAYPVVAPEREGDIRDASRDLDAGASLPDDRRGFDERLRVVGVFLHARGDGQDVGIEDDVLGGEADFIHQQAIGALADFDLAQGGVRLSLLVESHHDHAGPVAPDQPCLGKKVGLPLLEGNRVHHALALDAAEAGLDDAPLRAVDHDGDARDLGLGGDEVQEMGHAGLGVEQAFVHVDVEQVGPRADLVQRDRERRFVVVGLDEPAKERRTADVGALADQLKIRIGVQGDGFEAAEVGERVGLFGPGPSREPAYALGDAANVFGGGPAAASHDVDQAAGGKLRQQRPGGFGGFVVFSKSVGQAGVGVGGNPAGHDARQLGHVLAHLGGAQGAVDPHREGAGVGNGMPERVDGLSRENPPAGVRDGDRDHQGKPLPALFEDFVDRHQGGLGVEGVEDGFHQQQVHAAFDQSEGGFAVHRAQGLEADIARRRVGHVGGNRERARGRPDGARHPAGLVRGARRPGVRAAARQPGRLQVELEANRFEAVVGLGHAVGPEGIGLDDVGTGLEKGVVNRLDDGRRRQGEQFVVAGEVARVRGEALAAVVGLGQPPGLDHGPHGAIQHQDALVEESLDARRRHGAPGVPSGAGRRANGRSRVESRLSVRHKSPYLNIKVNVFGRSRAGLDRLPPG